MGTREKIINLYLAVDSKQLNKFNLWATLDYLKQKSDNGEPLDSLDTIGHLGVCLAYLKWMLEISATQYDTLVDYTVDAIEDIFGIYGLLSGICDRVDLKSRSFRLA